MSVQPLAAQSPQTQQAQEAPKAPAIDTVPQLKPVELTSEGTKAVSEEAIQKSLQNLNELLKAKQTNVALEYDSLSSPKKVNIVDLESGKVIRTMPPQAAVEIAEKAKNYILGMMVDRTV